MGIDKTDIKPIRVRDIILFIILVIFSILITLRLNSGNYT